MKQLTNATSDHVSPRMPRGARRRQRTRDAILDAAEEAFTRHGYRGARMEDVSEQADVAIGSIYGHFGNKDGLYLAIAERAAGWFADYMARAYREDLSPLEQVLAAGDAYLRFHAEHPGAFRFLAFDGVETKLPASDDPLRARVTEQVGAVVEGFQAKIVEAAAAGEVDPEIDPFLAARFLWGAWNGVVALGLRTDRLALTETEIEACLQHARVIVREGLARPASRGADGRSPARLVRLDQDERGVAGEGFEPSKA